MLSPYSRAGDMSNSILDVIRTDLSVLEGTGRPFGNNLRSFKRPQELLQ